MGKGVGLADLPADLRRVARVLKGDAERPQHTFGDDATAGVPRIGLAPVPAERDQHAERNRVELGERHDAIDRGQEPVVLHQQDVPLAGEVGARGNADGFLFLGDLDQRDVGVPLGLLQEEPEPCLRQRRERRDARGLDALEDGFRVLVGNRHVPPASADVAVYVIDQTSSLVRRRTRDTTGAVPASLGRAGLPPVPWFRRVPRASSGPPFVTG